MPKRERYLFVCTNRRPDGHPKGSCAASGAEDLLQRLKEALAKRGLARAKVRACGASCLDVCHLGPVLAIEPDHVFYGRVTEADVDPIADALAEGTILERLVIPTDQFDEPKR